MSLTPEDIRAIVAAFDASDWSELSLQHGDTRLDLSRDGSRSRVPTPAPIPAGPGPGGSAAPAETSPEVSAAAAAAPAAPAASAGAPAVTPATTDGVAVPAPSVGLFWASPQPGAPPFVEIGQSVRADTTVCIVEVMKLMNHVKAGADGIVAAVCVENGAMVEHGDTLIVITPEG